jgi:hypothetical protein
MSKHSQQVKRKCYLLLNNVDNTSDLNKPISSNTQTALDLKADKTNVLEKDNTTSFTPTQNFHPATKKYVDDEVAGVAIAALNDIGDVDVGAVADGQVLVYSASAGGWIPGTNGEVNVIEAVQAEGTPLSITSKTVNVTRASLGAAFTDTFTTTLNTTWTGTEAPFTKTQTVSGILSTDNPIVDVVMSGTFGTDETRAEQWGQVYRITTSTNEITLSAFEKPTVELPIQIKVVR